VTATPERLDAITARLEAATPGPWTVDAMDAGHSRYEMNVWVAAGNGDQVCDMDGLNRSHNEEHAKDDGYADAEFIANAPADVAYLLDLARKQAAALEAVRKIVDDKYRIWAAVCGNTCSKDLMGVDHDAIADEINSVIHAAITEALEATP